ncbi:MAG: hypothetical protein R3F14_42575 [Polyangiaceae bacterium]
MSRTLTPRAPRPFTGGQARPDKGALPGLRLSPRRLQSQPPLDPGLTTRERFLQHASEEPCTSCHTLIRPHRLRLRALDGAGFRDTENGKPIDTSGEIVSTPATNGTFDGTSASWTSS